MRERTLRTTRRTRLTAALVGLFVALPLAACATTAPAESSDPPPPAPPLSQPGGHDLTRDDVDTWLDGVVATGLRNSGIPGATVSVVADGEVLTERGYGVADTGTEGSPARPVDPEDTLFRIGSVSKVVSATAVMQLVEQGRLDLDADVQQYLDFDLDTPKGAVTLRHLLTHTAGFEEVIAGLIGTPGDELPLRDVVTTDPPAQVFTPGTTPSYSNYGASLAGYVVERVAGEPFADVLQHDVFDRAGMTSSTFAQPLPDGLDARLAKGYPDDSQPSVSTEVVNAAPAGAMSSTAADMATFMLAHLGELPDDQALLEPSTLDEMHRPALGEDDLGSFAEGQRMDLGFFDDSTPGVPAFGHDGDTTVFHTAMRLFPEHDSGIFVSLNGNGRAALDSHELRTAVLDGFADRYLRDADVDATTAGGASSPATGTADEAAGSGTSGTDAAALAGTYASSRTPFTNPGALLQLSGQTTVVPRADGTVAVTPKPIGMTTGVYEQVGPHAWREVGGDAVLATRVDGDQVSAISWGGAFTLLRVDTLHSASLVVPAAIAAIVVLLISVIAWPAPALARIGRRSPRGDAATVPARTSGPRSRSLLLSRLGQVATLVALLGWAVVAVQALSYQAVPGALLRVLQVFQLLGVVAIVPAAIAAWRAVRERRGAAAVTGRVLVVLALVALAWVAIAYRLLAPSVSF